MILDARPCPNNSHLNLVESANEEPTDRKNGYLWLLVASKTIDNAVDDTKPCLIDF